MWLKNKIVHFLFAFIIIFFLAFFLRTFKLSQIPAGLHQDEAWFAYNAFLISKTKANIYQEKWPLTVDMWGDHVSAIHSYMEIPFIWIFGVNTFAFRFTFTFFSLACLFLGAYLLYKLTKNKLIVIIFSLLFAISPWNLVMSRASSSVIIDTFFLLLLAVFYLNTLEWARDVKIWTNKQKMVLIIKLLMSYFLTIICYVTYFTSRLLIPPFLLALFIYVFWRKKSNKFVVLTSLSVVFLYLIFPFGILLNTDYAQGRFKETTVINNPTLKINFYSDITNSGHSGFPVLLTRILYNKVTENVRAFGQNYLNIISPSTLVFQNHPPKRYFVPNGNSVSLVEYLGILSLLGLVLIWPVREKLKRPALLLVFLLLITPIPSALTVDDYPNLQRGVIMTPFIQMAAAFGLYFVLNNIFRYFKISQIKQIYFSLLLTFLLSLLTFTHFFFGYFYHSKFYEPYYRSRAGEELAKWINQNIENSVMVWDHEAGVFFYPYLFGQKNINDYEIKKEGKYFLSAKSFQIGKRTYEKELCYSPTLKNEDYEYAILYTLNRTCEWADKNLIKVFSAKYDDGVEGYAVYKRAEERN